MSVLYISHERYLDHHAGDGHPERPDRLAAARAGAARARLGDELVELVPRPARLDEIQRVHAPDHVDRVARASADGIDWLDGDTGVSAASYEAAVLAAGAGLTAIEALDGGAVSAAFCAVRPPGHHATAARAMGFCLFNNVAVTAAALAERGERVLIVDYDAHHGNGTQAIFWEDPQVAYVSLHQHPLYPGTGSLGDTGGGPGLGTTVNIPLPAGATGATYRAAVDEVIAPFASGFGPTWLLISAGFDGHRADPLTDLGLSSGDIADLTAGLLELVPPGRRVAFLEGGYDLQALAACAAACVGALGGTRVAEEPPTGPGPGRDEVRSAAAVVRQGAPGPT